MVEFSYWFLRLWDLSAKITRNEVRSSKYNNPYPTEYTSYFGINEATEAANDRATKTQDKLTTLTSLQGGVLAVAGIFISGKTGVSFWLFFVGILLTLFGMILVLNALKVTVSIVPSYEKLTTGETTEDKLDLIEYINETNRRADFQADSNKAASSLIIIAMIFFSAAGITQKLQKPTTSLSQPTTSEIKSNDKQNTRPITPTQNQAISSQRIVPVSTDSQHKIDTGNKLNDSTKGGHLSSKSSNLAHNKPLPP